MTKKESAKPKATRYSDAIFDKICARIAGGESVRGICRDPDMPNEQTFYYWLNKAENESGGDSELSKKYARAREAQADAIFDECLSIADDAENDYMTRENADGSEVEVVNAENVQRSRLRIDTRKWMAGKLRPKKYGDKLEVEGNIRVGRIDVGFVDP